MNRDERFFRIITEISLMILLCLVFIPIVNKFTAVVFSLIVVHTLFWLFNGHYFVLMRYVNERQNCPIKFLSYIESINERVRNKSFLMAVAAFGSFSRGRFNASSDFDLRLVRRRGFVNSLKAFMFCAKERARAFLDGFPLDIYVFDLEEIAQKISPDECPIVMYDPDNVIHSSYLSSYIAFTEFREKFKESFFKE